MKENDKTLILVTVAFALGWWLHKQAPAGLVNLTITTDVNTWYSLSQNGGATVILGQSNGTKLVHLDPGDYELHADFQGG